VLDALETLFFVQRGGVLGRTVLLIDKASNADERLVYDTVVSWVDAGEGRRGAVFTTPMVAPWAEVPGR
jgi:hypothetical protein